MKRASLLICWALLFIAWFPLQAQQEPACRRLASPRHRPAMAQGQVRVPCVLIQFRDVPFTLEDPAACVDSLLNGPGSVRNYFLDNSLGVYEPVFDVLGPVTLDKYRAYYGRDILLPDGVRSDAAPELALYEACLQLDEEVDFSIYDMDCDGVLDQIVYVYAGHDQSQGAPTEAIWAHQWNFSLSEDAALRQATLDGVLLDTYCCAPELGGAQGETPTGIGIICHEFAHTLGLPDLYDTHPEGGRTAADASVYSLMCSGLGNDQGRTPPFLGAQERVLLGWLDLETLPLLQPGELVPDPVRINTAYRSLTDTEGEYFLYELRDGQGWDAPLPAGLVVYHVDCSAREVGEVTAAQRWDNWRDGTGVNDLPEHPCYYILPSAEPPVPGNLVYPGLMENLALEPRDWEGNVTGWQLTNLSWDGPALRLLVVRDDQPNLNGFVRDAEGNPVPDASLTVEGQSCTSGEDGYFRMELDPQTLPSPFMLRVLREGYREQWLDVSLDGRRVISVPVTLRREDEPDDASLSKYDRNAQRGYFSQPGIGAVRFTPEDLSPYVGGLLTEVSFYPYLLRDFGGDIWVTVDIGPRRVLTQKVELPSYGLYFRNTVDVSAAGIVIPEGEDLYIGYGSDTTGDGSFFVGTVYPAARPNSFYSPFHPEQSSWRPMVVERAGIAMNVVLSAVISENDQADDLGGMGYRYIQPGPGAWMSGDRFEPEICGLQEGEDPSVTWIYDGAPLSGSVVLESGKHVLEAYLRWSDGRQEILRKKFDIR